MHGALCVAAAEVVGCEKLTGIVAMLRRPTSLLRPAVRCPSIRYNMKIREGRGFTLEELKAAGIRKKEALSIGIAVDHRARDRSEEKLKRNVERLQAYKARLVVFPKNSKKPKKGDSSVSRNRRDPTRLEPELTLLSLSLFSNRLTTSSPTPPAISLLLSLSPLHPLTRSRAPSLPKRRRSTLSPPCARSAPMHDWSVSVLSVHRQKQRQRLPRTSKRTFRSSRSGEEVWLVFVWKVERRVSEGRTDQIRECHGQGC